MGSEMCIRDRSISVMIIVIEQIITATILNSYDKSFASKQGREEYHGDTEIQPSEGID